MTYIIWRIFSEILFSNLHKVHKIRWPVWSSGKTMQETLRLKQMGRQNMILRKFRLFETNDSPKTMITRISFHRQTQTPFMTMSLISH